jgi:hypothetical protein
MSGSIRPLAPMAIALAGGLLCACATTTPYQALKGGEGYSEQKIESNRYRVAFAGGPSTSRQTVETYLLYRAAELTLANGYDYFVLSGTTIDQRAARGGSVGFGFGGFSIGSSGGVGVGVGTSTGGGPSYLDQADVAMFHGTKPPDNPVAFDAHEIKANLEDEIKRPQS